MFSAFETRDPRYDGIFVTAVRTTGIFCRPTCPARKPKRQNVEFFPSVADALSAGYRACLRCRPLEPAGSTPEWARTLLAAVEADPAHRWTDQDLRRRFQLDPVRVRRWFQRSHGITFHAYSRARRLASALSHLTEGEALTQIAHEHGYESLSGFRDAFTRAFGMTPGSPGKGQVVLKRLNTPLGPMVAGATDEGICLLEFSDRRMLETQLRRVGKRFGQAPVPGDHPLIERLEGQLANYFSGDSAAFDLPLALSGTPFQERVWNALLEIPYGETISYDELARRVDCPGGQRAVGRANGDNRIAVVIPCHRVIRASGDLGGYGGGLPRKQWLLDLERGTVQERLFQDVDLGGDPIPSAEG
ncbi:MAG: methylated-DNA--[protein]-cysteine S-methyltransferase [Gemmatimonadetes bacterium]|nr:methylated-DNA--[protein]-cysteine S-methyltransferase [Gemmatimonadota bacterium]